MALREEHATPLGHLLLQKGDVDRTKLRAGLETHRSQGIPLGQALIAEGAVSQDDVWAALAVQWRMQITSLEHHWVDPLLANELVAAQAIAHGILPIRAGSGVAIVAMSDPRDQGAIDFAGRLLKMRVEPRLVTPGDLRRKQEQVYRQQLTQHSSGLLQAKAPDFSAHVTLTLRQKRALIGVGVLALLAMIVFGGTFFLALAGALVTLYAAVVMFRVYVTVRGAKSTDLIEVSRAEIDALTDFPVYTILCPLYKEAGVLPQLVKACSELEYPPSKLDVKLLLEEDDVETLEVVRGTALPPIFDVVVVPADGPRTKPKACNYGLQFARGAYCVIYDAEDIPAPDQLKKALAVFRRSGGEIGCVQAKLNYYNPTQNLVTKWFALEYTSWFDFFLPGLVDLELPVPLGGSSNHFPTRLLRDLGAWDPNNVTEDADLGMRLHRAGYRTALMDSTTLEEANSDFVNWMRQRSRWGKGYFISWLVLMRHPRQLRGDVGRRALASMHLTLGGTYVVALLNLGVWFLTLLWVLAQFNFIAYLFPDGIYYVGMVELVFGNFFFMYMGVWSASHRRTYELTHAGLVSPLYWLMASLAMLKAGMQLVTKPTFWEKTVHGLYDQTAVVTSASGEPAPDDEPQDGEPPATAPPAGDEPPVTSAPAPVLVGAGVAASEHGG